mmetsp:Transcript_21423/g.54951  ORF Transcript_21423/g.54951 Transcript_21423/m.54951 type:complete len:205 (+) Transcript_21423:326-940(+)
MVPTQPPARFISPTLTATLVGLAAEPGNSSSLRWHTATTELSVVRGSCGMVPRRKPIFQSSRLGTTSCGMLGPSRTLARACGAWTTASTRPSSTRMSATGMEVRQHPARIGAGGPRPCDPGSEVESSSASSQSALGRDSACCASAASLGSVDRRMKTTAAQPRSHPSRPAMPRYWPAAPSTYSTEEMPLCASLMPRPSCMPRMT